MNSPDYPDIILYQRCCLAGGITAALLGVVFPSGHPRGSHGVIQEMSVERGPVVTSDEATAVERLAKAINLFREMDNTIPSQVISVFLEVASSHDGVETRSLPERVGLSQASVSRAILHLAEADRNGRKKPGLRLIICRVSRKDARQRIVALTPKGRSLARRIERILST